MPPLFGGRSQRQAQILAHPANKAKALSSQQQGGASGTIPGTSTSALQVGYQTGMIQPYPALAPSPNGDQVAGVGAQVLSNSGKPVVVMGNLKATGGSDHADFEDGGFAFLDAAGNQVAGYSQPTGLWGFGGGAKLSNWEDMQETYSTAVSAGDTGIEINGWLDTSSWFDGGGNIITPGLYSAYIILLTTATGAAGQYLIAQSAFNAILPVSLDAVQAVTDAFPPARVAAYLTDVQALDAGDLPYAPIFRATIPSGASGWTVNCKSMLFRLAY